MVQYSPWTPVLAPKEQGVLGEPDLSKVEDGFRQSGRETGERMYFLPIVILKVEGGKSKTAA